MIKQHEYPTIFRYIDTDMVRKDNEYYDAKKVKDSMNKLYGIRIQEKGYGKKAFFDKYIRGVQMEEYVIVYRRTLFFNKTVIEKTRKLTPSEALKVASIFYKGVNRLLYGVLLVDAAFYDKHFTNDHFRIRGYNK